MAAAMCAECGDHPALYYSKKKRKLRGDKKHGLCKRCWQSSVDSNAAKNGEAPIRVR